MITTTAVMTTAALLAGALLAATEAHARVSLQTSQTVWDGVYTEEQAKRGQGLYAQGCARCHGQDLLGGEMAPALSDAQFRSNWEGVPVGDLFERVRVSMPQDSPGSMTRQQYADVLAFVFMRAGFPSGATELSTRTEMLQMIMFKATKP